MRVAVALLIFSSLGYGELDKNADFHFIDTECSVSGAEPAGISTRKGSNTYMSCVRKGRKAVTCTSRSLVRGDTFSGNDSANTDYEILIESDGLIALGSSLGNVKVVAVEETREASIGSVNFVVEKGIMLTKLCKAEYFTKKTRSAFKRQLGSK